MSENSDNAIEERRDTVNSEHAQRMLDTVLENPPPKRHFKQTMLFDLFLGFGLLLVVAGFSIGLMKKYITHMAKQSMIQNDYNTAIHLLENKPVPQFFSGSSGEENPSELLNQARYLDAMEKLDENNDDQSALNQLMQIPPGSRYFNWAQQGLKDRHRPSEVQLEGQAIQLEANPNAKNKLFNEEKGKAPAKVKEAVKEEASASLKDSAKKDE